MGAQLITKQEMLFDNLSKLNTGVIMFVGVTTKKALKKPRKDQTDETVIPDRFQTVTKYNYNVAKIGTDYSFEVNNQRANESKNTTFRAGSTYCHPISENLLVYKHNTKDSYYLRLYPNLCEKQDTITIYLDAQGNILSKEEFKEVERKYLSGWEDPEKRKEKAQENQGVENIVIVNNYSFENIKWVEIDGNIIVNELDDKTLDILTK